MILHGLPTHAFFAIVQPPGEKIPQFADGENPTISLKDPKTSDVFSVEIVDSWTFQKEDFEKMNAFSKLPYGIEAKKLLRVLEKRYPEISTCETIRFLLLRKLN